MEVDAIFHCFTDKKRALNDLDVAPQSMPHATKRKIPTPSAASKSVLNPSSVTKVSTTAHNGSYPAIRRVSGRILLLAFSQRYSSSKKKLSARNIHRQN